MEEREKSEEYTPQKGSVGGGSLSQGGRTIEYDAAADWIVLRKDEKPAAEIFHAAYFTKGADPAERPLTFVFNGGPGAASAYLHVGALGPRIARFNADGTVPKPPVRLVDNAESWLGFTDLVFVDPVGTGFSRIVPEKEKGEAGKDPKRDEKEYYGIKRDIESLGEFMQRFLSKHHRWESPVFVAGESYGGFRAAKLTRAAQQGYGIGINGAVILSPALEFSVLDSSDYDVLPWVDLFPTMAAAAAYHGRSKLFTPDTAHAKVLAEAEAFAFGPLARFLTAGALLPDSERTATVKKAARLLGLDPASVLRKGCRISAQAFSRELLADQRKVLGKYDASVTAPDPFPGRESYEGADPTLYGIERVFTGAVNAHLRKNLGVETDREYHLLSAEVYRSWKVDMERHALDSQIGATDDLRYGMSLNPHMKVLISHGIYDMVTPYFTANRLAAAMNLHEDIAGNLAVEHFEGGHMFYLWQASRRMFFQRMEGFYRDAL